MKNSTLIGIILVIVVIAGVAYYFFVYKKKEDEQKTKNAPAPLTNTQTAYADQAIDLSSEVSQGINSMFGLGGF